MPQGGDHGLAAADAVPEQRAAGPGRAVSWCSQPAMVAASSAPPWGQERLLTSCHLLLVLVDQSSEPIPPPDRACRGRPVPTRSTRHLRSPRCRSVSGGGAAASGPPQDRRGRRTQGADVDRLLSAVGLEFEWPSRGAHASHRSTRSSIGATTHRRGRRWVRRARPDGHQGVRAAELVAMRRAEPGQDLLTGAGQALLAPRPDPVRVPPTLCGPSHCIVPRCIVLRYKERNDMDARQAERPPNGGALC